MFCTDGLESNKRRYSWTFNGNAIPNKYKNSLQVDNFAKEYDNSLIKCFETEVSGSKTKTKKHLMSCTASDSEAAEPAYVWVRGKLDKQVIAVDDEGAEYECKVM